MQYLKQSFSLKYSRIDCETRIWNGLNYTTLTVKTQAELSIFWTRLILCELSLLFRLCVLSLLLMETRNLSLKKDKHELLGSLWWVSDRHSAESP